MTSDPTAAVHQSPTFRLYAVTACVGLLAGSLWLFVASKLHIEGAPFRLPLWALVGAFIATELLTVHIETRGEAHALAFSEIPTIAGLLLAGPGALVVSRAIGGVVVLGFIRRQSIHKLVFNLASFALEAVVAASVLYWLAGDRNPVSVGAWPGLFLALLTATLMSTGAVTLAITVFSGWPGRSMVRQVLAFGLLLCLANTATGIVLLSSVWDKSYGGLLVLGVVGILFLLYRSHTHLGERHKSLERLHAFTRELGESVDLEELEKSVVMGAREILRGDQGALLLPGIQTGVGATRVLARGDVVLRDTITGDELGRDLRRLMPDGVPRIYLAGEPLPGWLAEIGVKDAVMVPLTTDGAMVGAMVVANRLTEVSSFVEDDLRLFETLANHANVALANGRLVATLQHDAQEKARQALHDPVTGLPNRTMLKERLEMAIAAARGTELRVALVFVDLGTFKEVSDTLGTATGDRLLVEVRDRIQAFLPDGVELARFTGDQFALLVDGVTDPDVVMGLAETVLAEFDSPFTADDISLVLGANLGVALYPEHATTAELLLQRADAATYRARQEGSGIEVYAVDTDPYAPRRLALAADLREALERDEVDVYVQPKMSLSDGMVVGAEALVRWTHPRLGPLSPDQFVPAAEHTGVIRQLTSYVVRDALAQCRSWRDAGFDLSISVNLSGRNLFDTHLVEDIGEAISEAGVPASSLTLELTESTVMGESHRSMGVLLGLQQLGVRLSVDDFGTGYSSLTHLRSLPVTELKIDKSFVMTMTMNDQDAVIVRTLVELGRSLGLRTVAEGVESPEAKEMLRAYGCEEGQGYLFSRPVPAEQFTAWLARQPVRRIDRGQEVVPFNREPRRAVSADDRG